PEQDEERDERERGHVGPDRPVEALQRDPVQAPVGDAGGDGTADATVLRLVEGAPAAATQDVELVRRARPVPLRPAVRSVDALVGPPEADDGGVDARAAE